MPRAEAETALIPKGKHHAAGAALPHTTVWTPTGYTGAEQIFHTHSGGDLASVGGLPPVTGRAVLQVIGNTPGAPRKGCHTPPIHWKFLVKLNVGFCEGRIVKFPWSFHFVRENV